MTRILVAESEDFSPRALEILEQKSVVTLADLDRNGLLQAVTECDVLWVRLRSRIDAEVMDAAPNLKLIATNTTGLTHIDQAEAVRRGIEIVSLQGESNALRDIRATAELTIALMLSLLRRIPSASQHVRGGAWNRYEFKGNDLHNRIVGIVGYGRLGQIVARYVKAFDAHVLATDIPGKANSMETGIELVTLNDVLAGSDLVTLHTNLCESTFRLIGHRELQQMQPGAWLVNTARGELIDETALLASLELGHLSGAALDVLCNETNGVSENPLVRYAGTHDNLLLTPHIGGFTYESLEKSEFHLAKKLTKHLEDIAAVNRSNNDPE